MKLSPRTSHTIRRIHWPVVVIVVSVLIVGFNGSPFESVARIAEALTEPCIAHVIERICQ